MRIGFNGWSAFIALLVALASAAPVSAAGYWNVPSSFCQCMGCGWGAGYHAPPVLGLASCRELCSSNEIRLPYSPAPHYGCTYNSCAGGYCQPTQLEPRPNAPPTAPAPQASEAVAVPRAHRLFVRAPIEP